MTEGCEWADGPEECAGELRPVVVVSNLCGDDSPCSCEIIELLCAVHDPEGEVFA